MDVLQGVLDASPDAVLVVDAEGTIRQANRNVTAVLGYEPETLEGRVVEDLLRADDREHHAEHRRVYMGDPEPRPMGRGLDLYALHADGTSVPVEISLGVIDHEDEPYVVATIGDITTHQEREAELQRKNERLEEFASIVSHDLQSPLNVAEGRVATAQEECDSPHLEVAQRAHERMRRLIDDLLELAREGETTREDAPVDLADLVETCWETAATGDARLVVETTRTVHADQERLQQLLENLVTNSVEHGSTSSLDASVRPDGRVDQDGPGVTVTVGDLEGGFYVEDDGPGIPDDVGEQVFEMGYSGDGSTGLGLAIVRAIVDTHDWRIELTEGTAGGARFEITDIEKERV